MTKAVLRWAVRSSANALGNRALPFWRSIVGRLPNGKALRVAAEVTAVFPLSGTSAAFYGTGRPRWNPEISLHTNPRCPFARQFALTGWYEDSLTQELLNTDSHGLFVDVGAHYGYFSALWLSRHPENSCLAIEPIPSTYSLLEANLRGFGSRAHLAQVCVGDEERLARMSYDPDWPLLASVADEGIDVPMKPLMDLLTSYAGPIAVLKVDAEGWDVRILRTASDLFRKRRVGAVYWETATWNGAADPAQDDLVRELTRCGYVRIARPGLDMAYSLEPQSGS